MTIEEAVGVDSRGCDKKTGACLTHRGLYKRVIDYLGGLDAVTPYIPFTLDELANAADTDANFNNLPLETWDWAAGYNIMAHYIPTGSGIRGLCWKKQITCMSCSEGVCILKEAARMWLESASAQSNSTGE